ncbi:GL25173 [Drosophila persimilis]|uniref:GL25173 n=1 Tax=Drosophila persimilis TaxID=7234 RepID=B4GR98_DROPE|nr:GL25173 [Drosophila persimilis]
MSQGVIKILNNLLTILIVSACVFSRVQCNNSGKEFTSDADLLRNARLFEFLGESKHFAHTRSRPPGPNVFPLHRVNARSDGPAPPQNKYPAKYTLRSPLPPGGPHLMGLEQNGNFPFIENNPQHRGYHYDNSKPVRFAHFKDAVLDVGKNQFVRPEGILQYPSEQYIQNFKASHRFNGNVNVLQKNPGPAYTPIQQHEIPVQSAQYLHYPKPYAPPENYGPVQSKQAVMKKAQFPQEHSSYSVYEESEHFPKQGIPQNQGNFRHANCTENRFYYQAGQDVFVVKSDGNKAVKHVVLTPMAAQTTTPAPPSTPRNQNLQKSHKGFTQEPLRFEFTEQDAIRGHISYTQSPQGHKYTYETVYSTPHQTNLVQAPAPIAEVSKPIKEYSDDVEDSADTENSKQQQSEQSQIQTAGVANSQDDSKATESYCENICANVYDENDEIVCGSDGYMYTGETQLECYSSCLNISITIKSKGSCT